MSSSVPIHLVIPSQQKRHHRLVLAESNLPQTVKEYLEGTGIKPISSDVTKWTVLHQGRKIDISQPVSSLALKPGHALYALPAVPAPAADDTADAPAPPSMPHAQFSMALSMAFNHSGLQKIISGINSKESTQALWVACPQLASDPAALALLSKPETLLCLLRPQGYYKMLKEHPAVIHAAEYLMAAVHEDQAGHRSENKGNNTSVLSSLQYHLDALSDVDDDDDDQDMPMQQDGGNPLQRNTSFSAITPNQLAAAIAAATGATASNPGQHQPGDVAAAAAGPSSQLPPLQMPSFPASGASSATASSQPAPSASSGSTGITTSMIEQALQAAMRGAQAQQQQQASEPAQTVEDLTAKISNIVEMGVADEPMARRALQLMGGNVQAAIELILSGQEL